MEEMLKEFDEKWWREVNCDCEYCLEQNRKDFRAFIISALEERDKKWKTAILYNVASEDWERIEEAFKALIK